MLGGVGSLDLPSAGVNYRKQVKVQYMNTLIGPSCFIGTGVCGSSTAVGITDFPVCETIGSTSFHLIRRVGSIAV
jgi:hypothetical protein